MKIKHYETDDLLATTDQIRRELGREALILATRRIGGGGLLRRKQRYEIIAGMPTGDSMAAESSPSPSPRRTAIEAPEPDSDGPAARLELSQVALARRIATAAAERAASAPLADAERAPVTPIRAAEPAPAARGSDDRGLTMLSARLAEIEREVTRLRDRSRFQTGDSLPDEAAALLQRLADRGLSAKLTTAIAADATGAEGDAAFAVRRALMARLPAPRTIRASRGKRQTLVLTGPAGSGKTTAATKLALALREQGQRVLLATLDTMRVAGDARLMAYARALDLPVRVCYGAGELAEAMSGSGLDAIVVDTPGFNAYAPEEAMEFRRLLGQIPQAETILVVPAGISSADLEASIEYAGAGIAGLLITSADATGAPGAALTTLVETKLSALYIGDSHDALQPLIAGEREMLARLALGEPLRTPETRSPHAMLERIGA